MVTLLLELNHANWQKGDILQTWTRGQGPVVWLGLWVFCHTSSEPLMIWISLGSAFLPTFLLTFSVSIYRSFSRDVITVQNQKLKTHQVFIPIRLKRRHIYICLQFYSSIACFVWKLEHFEFLDYVGAWHKTTIEFAEKNILISRCWALLEVWALGKVLM